MLKNNIHNKECFFISFNNYTYTKSNQPEFQFVDKPNKPQKRSSYIRKVVKLDNKEEQFSMKQFQSVRKVSNAREMIDSLRRIGMCLNKVDISQLPKSNIDKVCFLYISNYENTHEPLGVGPFNDAYLFAFIHYKLGYKIVFLYNSDKETFKYTYFLICAFCYSETISHSCLILNGRKCFLKYLFIMCFLFILFNFFTVLAIIRPN